MVHGRLVSVTNVIRLPLYKAFDAPKENRLSRHCMARAWASNFGHVVLTYLLRQTVFGRSVDMGVANGDMTSIESNHLHMCTIKDKNDDRLKLIVQACQKWNASVSEEHRHE